MVKGGENMTQTVKEVQNKIQNKITETKHNEVALYDKDFDVNVGTEEIGQEDLNMPILKITQATSENAADKKIGWYVRSDTGEQMQEVPVSLVYVTTMESENYNKTAMEKVKVYFGYYYGTNEPFKMYVRGWGLASHREFQTELTHMKYKYHVPMLGLLVNLKTEKVTGTIQDTGKPYSVYKPVFEIVKENGQPILEQDKEQINFLVESASKFANLAKTSSENDVAQNEVNYDDIPDFE